MGNYSLDNGNDITCKATEVLRNYGYFWCKLQKLENTEMLTAISVLWRIANLSDSCRKKLLVSLVLSRAHVRFVT